MQIHRPRDFPHFDQAAAALAGVDGAASPRPSAGARGAASQRADEAAARERIREQDARLEVDVQRERFRLLSRAIKDPIWDWDILVADLAGRP